MTQFDRMTQFSSLKPGYLALKIAIFPVILIRLVRLTILLYRSLPWIFHRAQETDVAMAA